MSKLAGALDVRDHRFGAGAPFTVGIEEEYMLLDPASFDLVPGAERILETGRDGPYAAHIAPELFDSLVEFHTGVCSTVAEAADEIRRLRHYAVRAARDQRLRLGSAGTHPFSRFEDQRVMPRERYRALIDELQYENGHASQRHTAEVESTIYRLVQEALTSVGKHARATRVEVQVADGEGHVTVLVRDDGAGFDPGKGSAGFGLVGMRERLALVHGTLEIESAQGAGTAIRASIPVRRRATEPRSDGRAA